MISKWGVTNFKSIREANLDLAPLTIFTGVNNSGKSSFLQSIAMMAQSFKEGHIELNGDYVDLGKFDEIHHNNAPEENKTINIQFKTKKRKFISNYSLYEFPRKKIDHTIAKRPMNFDDANGDNNIDDEEISYDTYDEEASYDINDEESSYETSDEEFDYDTSDEEFDYDTSDEEIIYDSDDDNNIYKEKNTEYYDILLSKFEDAQLIEKVLKTRFFHKSENYPKIANSKEEIEKIWIGFVLFFSHNNFRYLKPIRDPSKQESDGINKFVNSNGSNTFAVLHYWYSKRVIQCFAPDVNDEIKYDINIKEAFIDVLKSWLNYFGLSDKCSVEQLNNKYDFKMHINDKLYDLLQLGTGVSQILPILVMCLTAPNNSTIIIQEPEAHFHPKVQSRLADFFIAMALTGRQCIIETHSEYLIEKLRCRILKTKQDILKKIKLYFVTERDGISHFKDIGINEYAALDEWPEDFFDESHKIASEIMDETIKKMGLDE